MAATPTPPPPKTDSGPRGTETRAQLLKTGLRLFATEGYDSVTTRALSTEAGTNIAAIAYHFGGRRELYQAILRQLVIDTEPYLRPQLATLPGDLAAAKNSPQALAGLIAGLVAGLAGIFFPANSCATGRP